MQGQKLRFTFRIPKIDYRLFVSALYDFNAHYLTNPDTA